MEIVSWLRELGLSQYEPLFAEHAINPEVLSDLTDSHLKEIGIPLGHRLRLLKAIAALNETQGAPARSSPANDLKPALQAERRHLTVMFVDLVGSTALSARLDPEEFGQALRAYQHFAAGEVTRFGGHVAKFMGDGVLAYFGWPQAHEDEAERAVRAALAIVEGVTVLRVPGAPLAARTGIATGLVVVGELIGEGVAREEAVVGDTPNLAARFQALSPPGAVVVADSTKRLLGRMFRFETLGAQTLRGFPEQIRGWRVLGAEQTESRFEALRETSGLALVGRDQEVALLLDRWRRAKEGEGQLLQLSGEAGIGKSRIVLALREKSNLPFGAIVGLQSSPYHVNSALWPLTDYLERAAGLLHEDDAAARLLKLEHMIGEAVENRDQAVLLVAELLGIPVGERTARDDLSPARRKALLFAALFAVIQAQGGDGPTLIVLEDAHWLDPTTLEFVELLVERIQRRPIALIITFRPEFKPPWPIYPHVTTLTLNRLGARQATSIVEQLTGGRSVPPEVMEQILAKTDGVPLFVEELTRTVLEAGLLSERDGGLVLAEPLPPLAIPSTLQDSLMARLDRMAPAKELAQTGAVIGREFSHELLVSVAEMPPERFDAAVADLLASELIFRRGVPPDALYVYKHALVQDAAYQSLLKSNRQKLHARVAQVLQTRFPQLCRNQPELLAQHFIGAGLTERAVEFWLKAGRHAIERSHYLEAIAHLSSGLLALAELPDSPDRNAREHELCSRLGAAYMATKGFAAPETEHAYLRAREACRASGNAEELFTATWGLWLVYQQRCDFVTASELLAELFTLAERSSNDGLQLEAHHASWTTFGNTPDLKKCWDHASQGMALYVADRHHHLKFTYGGHDPGVCCRYNGAVALWQMGFADRAGDTARQAVELAEKIAHPVSLALALLFSSFVHQHRREPSIVRELADRTIALCAEQGLVAQVLAAAHVMRGWARGAEGHPVEGVAEICSGLSALEKTRGTLRRPYYLALLAEARRAEGAVQEACQAAGQALTAAETTGDRRWEAEIRRLLGEIAFDSHGAADAREHLAQSLAVARAQGAKALELRAATSLARLLRIHQQEREARELLSPVLCWFREGLGTHDLREAKTLLVALEKKGSHAERAVPPGK